ncbi:hypothetical protein BpHYR1_025525 [Brachionus plicatilis]|uniref:Uncharacterized protein n=1 Tax=Brachionus plicatilis TaxID=10195 RepID=A0A3M7RBF4_BRAPC|nr:hypothetical protein BpHYR1_025525 [Brachionus plicatilis]
MFDLKMMLDKLIRFILEFLNTIRLFKNINQHDIKQLKQILLLTILDSYSNQLINMRCSNLFNWVLNDH